MQECVPRADLGFWRCEYQGQTLGFGDVSTMGGMYWRRIGLLLYMCLLQSVRYWRHGGLNQWDLLVAGLGFASPLED